jgi:hypothetical protein
MKRLLGFAVLLGVLTLVMVGAASSAKPTKGVWGTKFDTYFVDKTVQSGVLPIIGDTNALRASARTAAVATTAAAVGETRPWLGLDDTYGFYYSKNYELRAVGTHAEIWVANHVNRRAPSSTALPQVGQSSGTNFMDGDCRNGARTEVTDAQVNYLLGQFDSNIWPKEAVAFSIAPERDGSNQQLPPPFNGAGDGSKTVVLVDNVRDDNFYDLNNTQGNSYIAGFFSSQINDFFDRNVMTIDAFDWLHRTGANPPNDPVPGNNCTSAPARPFLYEGVFAHEYQHLLEHYEDPDELNWINEGLADWAQTLTGYVTPSNPITNAGFDSHIQCFLGWLTVSTPANPNPRAACGPENSLTRWEDQGPGEILADYGAAYSMMELLHGRYGDAFMSALHRGDANGFAGVDEALAATGNKKVDSQSIFDDWTLAVGLDGLIDDGYKTLGSAKETKFAIPTLHASILWNNPHAYSTPGAPSNGSDYVQLRDGSGAPLTGGQIQSLAFKGATSLPPSPLRWTVDANPPGQSGNPALYSGSGVNRDEAAVTPITVPSGSPTLSFRALWDLETGWDFSFVQISTDGGDTYTSIPCTDTTTDHDPGAVAEVVEKLPGFNGVSGGTGLWQSESCSLAAYAGQDVLLAFRAVNDPAVEGNGVLPRPGFWVDDVAIGSTIVSDGSSTAPFKSISQTKPTAVSNFTVTLLSIDSKSKKITVKRFPLTGEFSVSGNADVQKYIDKKADFVGAVVTYNDPGESVTQYAPYRLTVNGVVQPGGA